MRGFVTFLILLAGCLPAIVCSGCEYERMLNWWPTVAGIRLVAVIALAANRLDVIRVGLTFVAYEYFWYYSYRIVVDWGFSANNDVSVESVMMVLQSGVIGAGLLYALGTTRFFRWRAERGLPWWQAALYVPVCLVARMWS